jgi:predicted DNA-binding protein
MRKYKFYILQLMIINFLLLVGCKNSIDVLKERGVLGQPDYKTVEEEALSGDPLLDYRMPVPTNVTASQGVSASEVKVSWSSVDYGDVEVGYVVYRQESGSEWVRLTSLYNTLSETSYVDVKGSSEKEIKENKNYYYAVKAVYSDKNGETKSSRFSFASKGFVLSKPLNFTASFRDFDDKIRLSWDSAPGASFYKLEVALPQSGDASVPDTSTRQTIDMAIIGTSYDDRSEDANGVRSPGSIYYYRVCAARSADVVSGWTSWTAGTILAPGAPGKIQGIQISKGEYIDTVKLSWPVPANASTYDIYRETDPQGSFRRKLVSGLSVAEYEDIDVLPNVKYYYKICGVSDEGSEGRLSDVDVNQTYGFVLSKPESLDTVFTFKQSVAYTVCWPPVDGADRYALFRAGPFDSAQEVSTDSNGNEIIESLEFSDWTLVEDSLLTRTIYENSEWTPDDKFYCYKVVSLNSKYPEIPEDDAATPEDERVEAINAIFDANKEDYKGLSKVTVSKSAIEIPVEGQIVEVLSKDRNYEDKIAVKIAINSNISSYFYDRYQKYLKVRIVKTAYYGDEEGIDPFNEPGAQVPGTPAYFTKLNKPLPENIEIFNITSDQIREAQLNGYFIFVDPMHDYDKNGNPKESMTWSYLKWDREAIKHLRRKMPFDMEKAVKCHYKLEVAWDGAPSEWPVLSSDVKSGYPALSAESFAYLTIWFREVAFNRLWHLVSPAYNWGLGPIKNALLGAQSVNGEYNIKEGSTGRIWFWAKLKADLSGGYGKGGVEGVYKDWPGMSLTLKDKDGGYKDLDINVTLGADGYLSMWVTIDTPFYDGSVYFSNLKMLQLIYQNGVKGGVLEVYQNSKSAPDKILSYKLCNTAREIAGGPQGYTNINHKYSPFPIGTPGNWDQYGYSWQCYYGLYD